MSNLFTEFNPALVIFDKDGTLIDFNFMWGSWVEELARRLEARTEHSFQAALFPAMGYDPRTKRVAAGTPLAICTMQTLRDLTIDIVWREGFSRTEAEELTVLTWFSPNPVTLAKPLGDLPRLFSGLRARGIHPAIVTSDDRASTIATLEAIGVARMTDALVCADDGFANKPAPDMMLHICNTLHISPLRTFVVGDAVADMQAGRAAGVCACIGVLSGLTSERLLSQYTDVLLPNVDALIG